MPSFKIIKCDHAAYVVSSLKDALDFWVHGMGASVLRTATSKGEVLWNVTGAVGADAEIAMIEVAGQRIELLQYNNVSPANNASLRPFDAGAMHIALNVDDVYAALEVVGRYGYKPQGVPQHSSTGSISIYVVGPDNAAIEFRQPLSQ